MKLLLWFLVIFSSFLSLGQSVPLNSTIMIFNDYDLQKCESRVGHTYSEGNRRIHIVPTIYAQLDHQKKITSYYYKNTHAILQPFSLDYMRSYQQRLLSCIEYSYDLGMQVYLTPHVDDVKSKVARLFIDFSPTNNYKNFNYAQIMFNYLDQLNIEIQKDLYLSLIGENGKSLFNYTDHYEELVERLPVDLQIGLSFNFSMFFGNVYDFKKISFINRLDFLGVSAYYSISTSCSSKSFEAVAQSFWKTMRKMGMTKRMRLHFTEVGVGGSLKGALVSSYFPHKGQSGEYVLSRDPWQIKSNNKYRKSYYKCLLGFLKNTPTIQAAFLWNSDSWDVQGFYPYSSKYRDHDISSWIYDHNQAFISSE